LPYPCDYVAHVRAVFCMHAIQGYGEIATQAID